MSNQPSEWPQNFFDDLFAATMLEGRNKETIESAASFLFQSLRLVPEALVFDQCCGLGNLAHALADRGTEVIGCDLAESYISSARDTIYRGKTEFHVADARSFLPSRTCDGAYNWHTSFGFSEDDTENLAMLKMAHAALKSGARFVLETFNPAYSLRHYTETQILNKIIHGEPVRIFRKPVVDVMRGMLGSEWTYHLPDGTQHKRYGENRIYFVRDIEKMLVTCGFSVIDIFADTAGNPFSEHAPRIIFIAEKD